MGVYFLTGFPVLDHITLNAHGRAMVHRHCTACAVFALTKVPAQLEFCANRKWVYVWLTALSTYAQEVRLECRLQHTGTWSGSTTFPLPVLPPSSILPQYSWPFYQQIRLKFEEETSEMLRVRLEHGSVWCQNLDAPGNRLETPGKFWNVVLEKDGEDQLDRSCEKWRSVT